MRERHELLAAKARVLTCVWMVDFYANHPTMQRTRRESLAWYWRQQWSRAIDLTQSLNQRYGAANETSKKRCAGTGGAGTRTDRETPVSALRSGKRPEHSKGGRRRCFLPVSMLRGEGEA